MDSLLAAKSERVKAGSHCLNCRSSRCTNRATITRNSRNDKDLNDTPLFDVTNPNLQLKNRYIGTYHEIIRWIPNLMIIPKCNGVNEFVGHLTNPVNELVEESPRCKYVLHLLTVFCQLILQKIHSKRTKDCRKAIEKRLDIWNRGSYSELLNEARYLQSLMKSKFKRQTQGNDMLKRIMRLVHVSCIKQAAKLVRHRGSNGGILLLEDNVDKVSVLDKLKELHPKPSSITNEFILHEYSAKLPPFHSSTQFQWTYLQRTVSTKREQFQRLTSAIFGTFLRELVDEIDDPIFIEIAKLSYNKGGHGIKDPMKNVKSRFEGYLVIARANLLECDCDGIQLIQRQIIDNIRKQMCEQEKKKYIKITESQNGKWRHILEHSSTSASSAKCFNLAYN
ncbi:hypothetical protein GJ496_011985 [Pomphorhynchus laevis]|nr:hypothetical protein GJ496_011985 [Pomphorhynchus laevis]